MRRLPLTQVSVILQLFRIALCCCPCRTIFQNSLRYALPEGYGAILSKLLTVNSIRLGILPTTCVGFRYHVQRLLSGFSAFEVNTALSPEGRRTSVSLASARFACTDDALRLSTGYPSPAAPCFVSVPLRPLRQVPGI